MAGKYSIDEIMGHGDDEDNTSEIEVGDMFKTRKENHVGSKNVQDAEAVIKIQKS